MPHNYDLYATVQGRDILSLDRDLSARIIDPYAHLLMAHALDLKGGRAAETGLARVAHKRAVHRKTSGMLLPARNPFAGNSARTMAELGLVGIGASAIEVLPEGAAMLEFDFTLEKKFLSRDDAPFHPLDNPVRKERVFKLAMISGASWKGSLRAAAVDGLILREGDATKKANERLRLLRIFGAEKGADTVEAPEARQKERPARNIREYLDKYFKQIGAQAEFERRLQEEFRTEEEGPKGRLRCVPSFFDGIELDVINPRNRQTRAGTLPIPLEIVPAGSQARFSLLYFPFDVLHKPEKLCGEAQKDWQLIGEALVRMLRFNGFGAKKSSGCGKAANAIRNFRFKSKLIRTEPALTTVEALEGLYTCFEVTA